MENSRSAVCKGVWFCFIIVSIFMTVFCVSKAVENFITESSHVVIEHRQTDEMVYPPLKLCFSHWMSWVNWSEAERMNFTKHEVLFAVSFLTQVYTSESFDPKLVEKSFQQKMAANNISHIEDFYKAIAYKKRNIIRQPKEYDYEIVFEDLPAGSTPSPSSKSYYILCYKYSENQTKAMILQEKQMNYHPTLDGYVVDLFAGNILTYKHAIGKGLTEHEYEAHLDDYKVLFGKSEDPLPVFLFANGYNKNGIAISATSRLRIALKLSVHSWKNATNANCVQNRQWIDANSTCFAACENKFFAKAMTKIKGRKLISESIRLLSMKAIYRLEPKNRSKIAISSGSGESEKFDSVKDRRLKTESKIKEFQAELDMCIEKCKLEVGCEIWSYYDTRSNVIQFVMPDVSLYYPASVAVMKEKDLQTLENFIGNVGGLLGIWSGASVLTFLQIVYLCCCQGRVESVEVPPNKNQTRQVHETNM